MQGRGSVQWLVLPLLAIALLSSLNLFYIFPIQPAYADVTNGAVVAYRSNTGTNTLQSVKVRTYDSVTDTFGAEAELDGTGSNIRDSRVACSPVDNKCVIVSLSADGTLNSWVCTAGCGAASGWTGTFSADFADLWSAEPATADRPFDMAFENSGDLIILYDKVSTVSGEEVFTRTMTSAGTSFGTETAVNTQTADSATDRVYPFIRLAPKLGADNIGAVMLDDSNTDVNAMIWSGTAWGDNAAVTTAGSGANDETIGIAWETNSGHLLVTGGAGAEIGYREFTTSWQTAGTIGGVATGVGTINWITMKPTPRAAGNEVFLAFSGTLNDFASIQWSGTAWGTGTEHDAAIDGADTTRVFEIMTSPAADGDSATVDALLVWGTAANSFSYRSWSATNTYGTASTVSNSGTHAWFVSPYRANPTSGDTVDSLGITQDSAFDVSRIEWSGGANAPTAGEDEVTTDTVVNTWEGASLDWFYAAFNQQLSANPTLTITVGATPDTTLLYLKTIAQTVTVGNTVDTIQLLLKGVSETITVGHSTDEFIGFFANIPQSITVGDSAAAFRSFFSSVSETITVGESVARTALYNAQAALSLTVADSVDTIALMIINVPQGFVVTDDANRLAEYIRGVGESITVSDSAEAFRSFFANVSETITTTADVAINSARTVVVALTVGFNASVATIGGLIGGGLCELERLGILLDIPLPCE